MALHTARLRAQGNGWREANELLLYGSGFVTIASGRVLVPFFGRLRHVPSPEAERRIATAFPRAWHLMTLALVCLIGGRVALDAFGLNGAHRGFLLPLVVLACAGIWLWRQRLVIRTWPMVDDVAMTRTTIALGALDRLPRGLKIVHLVLYVGVALWFVFALLHSRPLSDPDWWIALPIMAYSLFAVLRAARGYGLGVMRATRR